MTVCCLDYDGKEGKTIKKIHIYDKCRFVLKNGKKASKEVLFLSA